MNSIAIWLYNNPTDESVTKINIIFQNIKSMPHGYIQAYSCRPIILCNIKYAHAVPANAGGLIDYYSLCSVHLLYPQNDHLRRGGQD